MILFRPAVYGWRWPKPVACVNYAAKFRRPRLRHSLREEPVSCGRACQSPRWSITRCHAATTRRVRSACPVHDAAEYASIEIFKEVGWEASACSTVSPSALRRSAPRRAAPCRSALYSFAPSRSAHARLTPARLALGDLHGAQEALRPALELPPERRIEQLAVGLVSVRSALVLPRYARAQIAREIIQEVDQYQVEAAVRSLLLA